MWCACGDRRLPRLPLSGRRTSELRDSRTLETREGRQAQFTAESRLLERHEACILSTFRLPSGLEQALFIIGFLTYSIPIPASILTNVSARLKLPPTTFRTVLLITKDFAWTLWASTKNVCWLVVSIVTCGRVKRHRKVSDLALALGGDDEDREALCAAPTCSYPLALLRRMAAFLSIVWRRLCFMLKKGRHEGGPMAKVHSGRLSKVTIVAAATKRASAVLKDEKGRGTGTPL